MGHSDFLRGKISSKEREKKGLVGKGLTGLVPRGRESKANDTCYEQVAQAAPVCKPCVSH